MEDGLISTQKGVGMEWMISGILDKKMWKAWNKVWNCFCKGLEKFDFPTVKIFFKKLYRDR